MSNIRDYGKVAANKKPDWLKIKLQGGETYAETAKIVREHGLHTICNSGMCPNKTECWNRRTATFMILGDVCTRECRFCATRTGKPLPPDEDEPRRVGESIALMGLKHAVITSVTRDDLADGGASHWATVVRAVRAANPDTTIELLIPDFKADRRCIDIVAGSSPDITGHNMETVERLTPLIRSRASYRTSLLTIKLISESGIIAKSGLMVGLGESDDEVIGTLNDMYEHGCRIVTLGQYLRPTLRHWPVSTYVEPEKFEWYREQALDMGFDYVASAPLGFMKRMRRMDMGIIKYEECLALQRDIFDSLIDAKENMARGGCAGEPENMTEQTLILCEHPHVYTLGKSGKENNMLVDGSFLQTVGASFHRTDRGGDVTYHGPGQLVGYPILDLEELGLGLKQYIYLLEAAIIDTLAEFGIEEKRWVVKPQGDPGTVDRLSSVLGIPRVLANLLVQRGIHTNEQAEKFFNPRLEDLHDPFLMKDMDRAVKRVELAVKRNERIMVYGDYDVDGTTAVALVYIFLRRLGHENLTFYIPDRYAEGYGVSLRGIDYAKSQDVSLIITLDCGIKAIQRVLYAKEKGIDLIICDHHLPGDEIPDAVAVLNPKRPDCCYPFKELSGCGVGFKLVQAYSKVNGVPFAEIERLLDLVAVSIAADIVPVTDENRILSYYGLRRLNEKPNKGLLSIIKICGLDNHTITIDDIVFKIGPRINAAGRMAVEIAEEGRMIPSGGHSAVNLMIERNDEAAEEFGNIIDIYNQDRKNIDRSVTQHAHEIIEGDPDIKGRKSIVVYNPQWMKGIVGIVASRLIETYHKPSVVLTMNHGFVTGSARSVHGFDIYQAVEACADLLENFGGHTYAAGMTMKTENVAEFTERFNCYVEDNIDDEMLTPQIEIDSMLLFSDITPEFRKQLCRFQPFGPGNTSPVFASCAVSDCGNAKLVGVESEHLKMDLMQSSRPYTMMSAIAFQQPSLHEFIRKGTPIDVCYNVVENHYRGSVTPQLRIRDIKMCVK
ncbi:single-stranded-dna-specific exonuclease recj [Holotrichia oblita]|uniref:Single-stranded-dna-specific exonuclease recj n=1 Tax=Holotrichia oblita TaxID=644536 RepID=A0ACB9TRB2_HOLOL|nr:single-stranded-dna-specific exonuclease recj [Holotrichia oblita]